MSGKKKIIIIVLVIILVVSIWGILFYLNSQQESKDTNERLQEIAATQVDEDANAEDTSKDTSAGLDEPFVSPINFAALKQENEDIYGWICIEDTVIDYPILQSSEDEPDYYADYTVDHVKGYPGAIFTESDLNKDPFEDAVTVVYGHRMKNDTMFGSLDNWEDDEYRDNHSTIQVFTEKHTYKYQIAFVQVYDTRNILATYDCNTESGYSEFLKSLENVHSIPYWHSDEIKTSTDTPMIVLSTCYGDNRLLIGAVLTEKE